MATKMASTGSDASELLQRTGHYERAIVDVFPLMPPEVHAVIRII